MNPSIPVRVALESVDVAVSASEKIEALACSAEAEGTATGIETARALRAFVEALSCARRHGRAACRGLERRPGELAIKRGKRGGVLA